jgi:hypothetical protein
MVFEDPDEQGHPVSMPPNRFQVLACIASGGVPKSMSPGVSLPPNSPTKAGTDVERLPKASGQASPLSGYRVDH